MNIKCLRRLTLVNNPLHRAVRRLPAPVIGVRTVCVRLYLPTFRPVLRQASSSLGGETQCAVSSTYNHLLPQASTAVLVRPKPLTASHVSAEKYTTSCPANMVYSYKTTGCNQGCRSLSQPDTTCQIAFTPVDGCGCAEGTHLNEKGECVPASKCPCYDKFHPIQPGNNVRIQGANWWGFHCSNSSPLMICCYALIYFPMCLFQLLVSASVGGSTVMENQTLHVGTQHSAHMIISNIMYGVFFNTIFSSACTAPMVFFNCSNAPVDAKGSECQRSCLSADTECVNWLLLFHHGIEGS